MNTSYGVHRDGDGNLVNLQQFLNATPGIGADITDSFALANGSTNSRTMGARFADQINIKDFGAIGDGVADDTAAIKAAVAAATTNPKVIIFPEGEYNISTNTEGEILFDVPTNTIIRGEGNPILRVQPNSLRKFRVFGFFDCEDGGIENITVIGNKATNTAPNADGQAPGITFNGCSRMFVRDVVSNGHMGDGATLGGLDYFSNKEITFTNCIFDDNGRQGCSVIHAEDITFDSCTFSNSIGYDPQCGVDIEPNPGRPKPQFVRRVTFKDCKFTGNNADGLRLDGKIEDGYATVSDIRTISCYYENNNNNSFLILGGTDRVSCLNDISRNTNGYSFSIFNSSGANSNISFVGCTSEGSSNSGFYSDQVTEKLEIRGCSITGNGFSSDTRYGISLRLCNRALILNNRIYDAARGVQLLICTECLVDGNYFENITKPAVRIAGTGTLAQRNVIQNNVFNSCATAASDNDSSHRGCPVYFSANSPNNISRNNTFMGTPPSSSYYAAEFNASSGNKMVNDIYGDSGTTVYNSVSAPPSTEVVALTFNTSPVLTP